MLRSQLDHIIVIAPNLEVGVEFVHASLGVMPQVGGEHPRMGTRNYLLKLGESIYLEVISPNPSAPKPERPRWFGLDEFEPNAQPRLATWVARTTDIRAALAKCSESLGIIEPMSRGELNWLVTIPPDGSLPFGGAAPALIEWNVDTHPASKLKDAGCSLLSIEVFHPDTTRISRLLESIGFEGDVSVSPLSDGENPYMVAHISTPTGPKQLCAPNPMLDLTRGAGAPLAG